MMDSAQAEKEFEAAAEINLTFVIAEWMAEEMIGRIMRRRANEQPVVGLSLALPNVNQSIRTKFTGGAASLPLCLPLVNGICTDRLLLSVPEWAACCQWHGRIPTNYTHCPADINSNTAFITASRFLCVRALAKNIALYWPFKSSDSLASSGPITPAAVCYLCHCSFACNWSR